MTDVESRRWKFGTLSSQVLPTDISSYAKKILLSEIDPLPRGEALPPSNDEFVKVIVRDTWDEYVYDQDKEDVFVLIHTAEGDVSAQMMSIFHAVGDLFQQFNSQGVSLVSCDTLNNAIPGMEEFQFTPAVFHFPPKSKRDAAASALENDTGISMYQGGPDMNSLINFIKSVSTVAEIPYDVTCDADASVIDDFDEEQNSTDTAEMTMNGSKQSMNARSSTTLTTDGASHTEL